MKGNEKMENKMAMENIFLKLEKYMKGSESKE